MRKFIYWAPRILSIIFILFLALFSLDVFQPGLTTSQIALGLFMHNLPSLFLLLILIISWKYEIVGGIAFSLAGLGFIAYGLLKNKIDIDLFISFLVVAVPAIIVGFLFLLGWFRKK